MIAIQDEQEEFFYYFDIDKIIDFLFEPNKNSSDKNQKTEKIYDEDEHLINKVVTTEKLDSRVFDVKYDIFKTLLSEIAQPSVESEDGTSFSPIKSLDGTGIGFKISLNTMLNYGFLKNKN